MSLVPIGEAHERKRPMGKVYLVGAGPGDPDLLTLKGRRCLENGDVVVYDALVDARLLNFCRPGTRFIYAGKREGRHTIPQDRINMILVQEARGGRTVVRLKGGDPFMFGRGGEEAQALAAAGVPFEIVPGVSSGVAAPAYAGIPITHRDITPDVTFITGHESCTRTTPAVRWDLHAKTTSTLVIFMGLHNLPAIAYVLATQGRGADCPAAVIQCGTTASQFTVTGTLRDIAARVQAAGLRPPAIIVVGEVVGLRDQLQWFAERAGLADAATAGE